MRYIQKTGAKGNGGKPTGNRAAGARYLLLRPAGYALKSMFQDYPVVSDPKLFQRYAREQWHGEVVRSGSYLFDRRLYPDFAFKVVRVFPNLSAVGLDTRIVVEKTPEPACAISQVAFDDVIGQETAKRKIRVVEKFLAEPDKFGRWAPRNILFYGASGTGKTMIARALANEAKVPLIPVKSTTLIGEFVGEGARQIHSLYERAEQMAPCILFVDELDAIALDRRYQDLRGDVSEIVNSLLTEMDGIHLRRGVCTIASTNKVEYLDASVRSRFEEEIEFGLPTPLERLMILEANAKTIPVEINADLKRIAEVTEGFSGRDLVEKVLKSAVHQAIMDDSSIGHEQLESAVKRAKKNYKDAPVEMFA